MGKFFWVPVLLWRQSAKSSTGYLHEATSPRGRACESGAAQPPVLAAPAASPAEGRARRAKLFPIACLVGSMILGAQAQTHSNTEDNAAFTSPHLQACAVERCGDPARAPRFIRSNGQLEVVRPPEVNRRAEQIWQTEYKPALVETIRADLQMARAMDRQTLAALNSPAVWSQLMQSSDLQSARAALGAFHALVKIGGDLDNLPEPEWESILGDGRVCRKRLGNHLVSSFDLGSTPDLVQLTAHFLCSGLRLQQLRSLHQVLGSEARVAQVLLGAGEEDTLEFLARMARQSREGAESLRRKMGPLMTTLLAPEDSRETWRKAESRIPLSLEGEEDLHGLWRLIQLLVEALGDEASRAALARLGESALQELRSPSFQQTLSARLNEPFPSISAIQSKVEQTCRTRYVEHERLLPSGQSLASFQERTTRVQRYFPAAVAELVDSPSERARLLEGLSRVRVSYPPSPETFRARERERLTAVRRDKQRSLAILRDRPALSLIYHLVVTIKPTMAEEVRNQAESVCNVRMNHWVQLQHSDLSSAASPDIGVSSLSLLDHDTGLWVYLHEMGHQLERSSLRTRHDVIAATNVSTPEEILGDSFLDRNLYSAHQCLVERHPLAARAHVAPRPTDDRAQTPHTHQWVREDFADLFASTVLRIAATADPSFAPVRKAMGCGLLASDGSNWGHLDAAPPVPAENSNLSSGLALTPLKIEGSGPRHSDKILRVLLSALDAGDLDATPSCREALHELRTHSNGRPWACPAPVSRR